MQKIPIAYVIDRSFTERDFNRYGVSELAKKFNFYIVDLSGIVHKSSNKDDDFISQNSNLYFEQLHCFDNVEALKDFLSKNLILYYIDLMGVDSSCSKIRQVLKYKNIKRIKFYLGELPQLHSATNFFSRLKSAILKGNFFNKAFNYLYRKFFIQINEPQIDISVYSGNICKERFIEENKKIIWAHALDYEVYLNRVEQVKPERIKNYAVFLDQNAPFHPDYTFHNNRAPVKASNYFKSLNAFFDDIEEITGLEIIIASHPRTTINNDFWGDRKSISENTPELVQHANLVLAHYSTAISFAVLWGKPILQLTTNEYINSYRHDRFLAFASALDLNLLNTDNYKKENLKKEDLFEVNKVLYKNYEDLYLRSDNAKRDRLWSIVSDEIYSHYASQSGNV